MHFRVPCLLGIALFNGVLGPQCQEGGLGGSSPHYRVYLSPCAERGVWGDPPPIIGCTWPPCAKRGVWGDPPPHSRDKVGFVGMIKFSPLKIKPCSPWVCWVFLPLPCSPWVCWAFFPLPCSPWGMLGVFPIAPFGFHAQHVYNLIFFD